MVSKLGLLKRVRANGVEPVVGAGSNVGDGGGSMDRGSHFLQKMAGGVWPSDPKGIRNSDPKRSQRLKPWL